MNVFELVGQIALKGAGEAQKQLQGLEGYVKQNEKAFKAMGAAMTGFGVAITGTLAMSIKSAAQEEAGIVKLTQALKNVGVEYDAVKDSLEANINATQQKTSIADDRQREGLQRLLEVTGDYKTSLDLLPLALDMATAKGMDAASASEIIGRVAAGNTTILARYGIQLKEGATATEALGALQEKFGGQAEAYGQTMAGQFDLLKNNISDVMEAIGSQLLPILTDLFENHIQPVVTNIKAWIEENPKLAKTIIIVAGAFGILATALGPLLFMLPSLVSSFVIIRTFLLTKLIPSIVATTVALWGKVTALFAVLAAAGPAGWVALAAGIALIGLTAVLVTQKIKGITGATDESIDAASEYGKIASDSATKVASGQGLINEQLEKEIELRNKLEPYHMNLIKLANEGQVPWEVIATQLPGYEKFHGLPSYQGGGPIIEDTVLMGLKSGPYAIAHEGERVGGAISISGNNFYVREETDIDKIAQSLMDKVRLQGGR